MEALIPYIIMLLIGAVAGFLAGSIVQGFGFGLIGNIIVGILGAFVGSYLFKQFNIPLNTGTDILDMIIVATIGAVVLLVAIGIVKRVIA